MLKPFGVLYVHDDPTHAEVRADLWTESLSRSMGARVRVVPATTLRTAQIAILALTAETRLVTAFIHKDLGQHPELYGSQVLSELHEGMLPVAALTHNSLLKSAGVFFRENMLRACARSAVLLLLQVETISVTRFMISICSDYLPEDWLAHMSCV